MVDQSATSVRGAIDVLCGGSSVSTESINGTNQPESALVLVAVEEKTVGDLSITFDTGETFDGPALVLTIKVVDVETKRKSLVDLVVPRSLGPELLVNLLTDEQWEAVCNV